MTTMTLVTSHPDPQSFSRSLANAYARGATAHGVTVRHFDATALRFDLVLRGAHTTPMHDEPDLATLRAAVDASAHVAWFFPTWWAGLPAALKGLVDRLFLPKVSFLYEGGLPRGLLKGRSSRYVATMDSPALWYWLAHHDALGGSFGRGTLQFVGFGPVQRTLIYGVRTLSEDARGTWLRRLEALGATDAQRLLARRPTARLPGRPTPEDREQRPPPSRWSSLFSRPLALARLARMKTSWERDESYDQRARPELDPWEVRLHEGYHPLYDYSSTLVTTHGEWPEARAARPRLEVLDADMVREADAAVAGAGSIERFVKWKAADDLNAAAWARVPIEALVVDAQTPRALLRFHTLHHQRGASHATTGANWWVRVDPHRGVVSRSR